MREFVVDDLRSNESKYRIDIQALGDAPVYDVSIANSAFENVSDGHIVKNLKGLKLNNVRVNGKLVSELE